MLLSSVSFENNLYFSITLKLFLSYALLVHSLPMPVWWGHWGLVKLRKGACVLNSGLEFEARPFLCLALFKNCFTLLDSNSMINFVKSFHIWPKLFPRLCFLSGIWTLAGCLHISHPVLWFMGCCVLSRNCGSSLGRSSFLCEVPWSGIFFSCTLFKRNQGTKRKSEIN